MGQITRQRPLILRADCLRKEGFQRQQAPDANTGEGPIEVRRQAQPCQRDGADVSRHQRIDQGHRHVANLVEHNRRGELEGVL